VVARRVARIKVDNVLRGSLRFISKRMQLLPLAKSCRHARIRVWQECELFGCAMAESHSSDGYVYWAGVDDINDEAGSLAGGVSDDLHVELMRDDDALTAAYI